jgi:hypothetical protein
MVFRREALNWQNRSSSVGCLSNAILRLDASVTFSRTADHKHVTLYYARACSDRRPVSCCPFEAVPPKRGKNHEFFGCCSSDFFSVSFYSFLHSGAPLVVVGIASSQTSNIAALITPSEAGAARNQLISRLYSPDFVPHAGRCCCRFQPSFYFLSTVSS